VPEDSALLCALRPVALQNTHNACTRGKLQLNTKFLPARRYLEHLLENLLTTLNSSFRVGNNAAQTKLVYLIVEVRQLKCAGGSVKRAANQTTSKSRYRKIRIILGERSHQVLVSCPTILPVLVLLRDCH
jgi:hypothetical protein